MPYRELKFEPWLYRLNERLSIVRQNIKTGQALQETDVDILQSLHKLHFNGDVVFTEVIEEKPDKKEVKPINFDKKTAKP